MRFEDIYIHDVYEIHFLDLQYPCNCICHLDSNKKHIIPCCQDKSYCGPALCIAKDYTNKTLLFAASSIKALVLNPGSVLKRSRSIIRIKIGYRNALKKLAGFN